MSPRCYSFRLLLVLILQGSDAVIVLNFSRIIFYEPLFPYLSESDHEYVLLSVIFVALIKIMHSRPSVFYKSLISFFIRAEQNVIF